MNQYVFCLTWSQTDKEFIVVRARNCIEAMAYADRLGAQRVDYHEKVDKFHEI